MPTRIKICCISSIEEANLAISLGADALGLVSSMPSGPGVITEDLIAKIAGHIPPGVTSVLLTSRQSSQEIIEQNKQCRTNAIQLCNRITSDSYQELHESMPGISLIQVIHVTDQDSINTAKVIAQYVDALLLDSGNPAGTTVELGGTGRTHNWEISRQICEQIEIPVFLAGGLNSENIREAIDKVNPYAIDVCSGVRTDGKLDMAKLSAFIKLVKLRH